MKISRVFNSSVAVNPNLVIAWVVTFFVVFSETAVYHKSRKIPLFYHVWLL